MAGRQKPRSFKVSLKPYSAGTTKRKPKVLQTASEKTQAAAKPPGRTAKQGHTIRRSYHKGTKDLKGLRGSGMRHAAKRRAQLANATVTGINRPECKLDAQAKKLGVYDSAFHCMTRTERKSVVSTALTKSKAA